MDLMDQPFNLLHQLKRIVFLQSLKMKEEQAAREAEEAAKNKANSKNPNQRQQQSRNPAVKSPMKQTPPSNISIDDIEEFIEEGM